MKTLFFTFIFTLFLCAIDAQEVYQMQIPETLPPEPMKDSLVVEYYFVFGKAWDDTVYYSNIFFMYQGGDTLAFEKTKKHWDKQLKNTYKFREYTGFLRGPYYDSLIASENQKAWMVSVPDTMPLQQIWYDPPERKKPSKEKKEKEAKEEKVEKSE